MTVTMTLGVRTLALLLLLEPAAIAAQEVIDLDAEPTCGTCRPSLALRTRLSFANADVSPYYSASVAGHVGGVWAVASAPTYPGSIVQFPDPDRPRRLGRKGGGPGEFDGMILLRTAPHGVLAYDSGNLRLTEIRDDGTLGNPIPVRSSSVRDWAVLSSSEVLLVGAHRYEGSYYALMKLNLETGEQVYGRRLPEDALIDPSLGLPVVGLDGRGHATVAHRSGRDIYTVRLSDLTTVWEARIEQEDLPKRPTSPEANINRVEPVVQVFGLEYDGMGNLWIFVAGPDEDWRPGGADDGKSLHELMDMHLYVLDGRTHVLKARRRFDHVAMPGDQGMAFSYLDDVDEIGVFELYLDGVGRDPHPTPPNELTPIADATKPR